MQAEELVALAQEIRRQRTEKQTIELKAANKGSHKKYTGVS